MFVDGNGVFHYRRFGLASHFGVLANIPTIGIAKNLLCVDGISKKNIQKFYAPRLLSKGDYVYIYSPKDGFCLGKKIIRRA